uniref:Reverse transcriptase Ty1/copia-type domain-containing protein n=1 Tax=Solanum lycopersicum TaxID=4081 RepID=A0A3Q7EKT8_SOLLC
MLNHHTLDEVTCDQVPIPENTPITESTTPPTELNIPVTAPTGPNVSVLTPRRTTRSCHPPSYLKDYNYSLPKLHSSSPINNVVDSQHSLTSFTNHPDHGYVHSDSDYSLFYKKNVHSLVFVAVYVDDSILTGTDIKEIESLKFFLHEKFRIKDLGRLHYFLGLEILYRHDGVLISQRKFTIDLLKEFDSMNYKSTTSPLDPTEKLRLTEGKLLPYLKAAYHILRYLQHDPTLGVFINNRPDITINAYWDSDWASCPDSRKSVSGYLVLMGDSPISWKSKKQPIVSLSSTEAEYRAIRQVVGEVLTLLVSSASIAGFIRIDNYKATKLKIKSRSTNPYVQLDLKMSKISFYLLKNENDKMYLYAPFLLARLLY